LITIIPNYNVVHKIRPRRDDRQIMDDATETRTKLQLNICRPNANSPLLFAFVRRFQKDASRLNSSGRCETHSRNVTTLI